ncbi:hypothetical protein RvY_11071 [Ramazzottius varieornatus]|uniref:Uncharacterized protein n=1 Tax=Ramazzottius varieornatus TaxID=947166 RepID=A0A1D1VEX0_RAMVA|nr:hypothetical protein RvY_11071 [Ramazzottius varieornatus]
MRPMMQYVNGGRQGELPLHKGHGKDKREFSAHCALAVPASCITPTELQCDRCVTSPRDKTSSGSAEDTFGSSTSIAHVFDLVQSIYITGRNKNLNRRRNLVLSVLNTMLHNTCCAVEVLQRAKAALFPPICINVPPCIVFVNRCSLRGDFSNPPPLILKPTSQLDREEFSL